MIFNFNWSVIDEVVTKICWLTFLDHSPYSCEQNVINIYS